MDQATLDIKYSELLQWLLDRYLIPKDWPNRLEIIKSKKTEIIETLFNSQNEDFQKIKKMFKIFESTPVESIPYNDYSKLKHFDKIYIPLKYFSDKNYTEILKVLENKSNLYIYMPVVVKDRYLTTIESLVKNAINSFKIKGAVVSEMSSIHLFKNMDIIANYNFNIFNSYTAFELKNLGFTNITLSPELSPDELSNIKANNI